jgi:hypothetical protein
MGFIVFMRWKPMAVQPGAFIIGYAVRRAFTAYTTYMVKGM